MAVSTVGILKLSQARSGPAMARQGRLIAAGFDLCRFCLRIDVCFCIQILMIFCMVITIFHDIKHAAMQDDKKQQNIKQ
ncbi:hypothetical protein JOS77_02445 [Chromobacterium haemolyticum]|nr:hypothetical protein JOS77_02445 [Chromobacterium haemolyticum]